jgi:hypothetical protein
VHPHKFTTMDEHRPYQIRLRTMRNPTRRKQRKIPSWNFSHPPRKIRTSQQTLYIDGSKKDKKVGYAVVLSNSTIRRRQFPQNYKLSHNKRYLLHRELQPKMSNHHRLTQHYNSSLRQKKIQEPKNSIDPKTDRSSIHQYYITMGSK